MGFYIYQDLNALFFHLKKERYYNTVNSTGKGEWPVEMRPFAVSFDTIQ